jgi:opacity protein-like surface antigen
MNRLACIAVITLAALGMARPALAQGSFLVGPHMGIQDQTGADETNSLFGATARMKLLPVLGVDGMISYRQDDMSGGIGRVRTWPVMVTGLVYPLPFIYGGAGGGWYHTTYDFNDQTNDLGIDDQTNTEFGWHLALGAEIPASTWLKFTADYRWVYMGDAAPDLPDVVAGDVPTDFRLITLGMLFSL